MSYGLNIYDNYGDLVFNKDHAKFLTEIRTDEVKRRVDAYHSQGKLLMLPIHTPPYAVEIPQDGGTSEDRNSVVYLYRGLEVPPVNIGYTEPYGLRTFEDTGQLILSPERRPLTVSNVKTIHRVVGSNASSPSGISNSLTYGNVRFHIGPAQGNAVVCLNARSREATSYTGRSVAYRHVQIRIERTGGQYYVNFLWYSFTYSMDGYERTYRQYISGVFGLTPIPR